MIPILSALCRFHGGWTLEYTLGLPAALFFELASQMRKAKAMDRIEELDISKTAATEFKHYEALRKSYSSVLNIKPKHKPRVENQGLSWGDPRARNTMRQIFGDYRRSKYGR